MSDKTDIGINDWDDQLRYRKKVSDVKRHKVHHLEGNTTVPKEVVDACDYDAIAAENSALATLARRLERETISLSAQVRELREENEALKCARDEYVRQRDALEQSLSTARESALEEAAKIVDGTDCMDGEPTAAVIAVMEQHGVVESSRAACRATKREISKAIRALKPTGG